jgi:pimeloyl-ACP methyl ester carboxylesterase
MNTSQSRFDVVGEQLAVEVYSPTMERKPNAAVLVLHGAGQSDKRRCKTSCEVLAALGCRCVTFDFSGAGESTHCYPLTLDKRTSEARAVLQEYCPSDLPRYVVAFSMSGHSAIELAADPMLQISGLILCSPAIYCEESYRIPFGAEFTTCLRRPLSWRSSASPRNLSKYDGRVCVIRPVKDDVIPEDVFSILESVIPSANYSKIVIDDAAHALGAWFNEHPKKAALAIGQAWHYLADFRVTDHTSIFRIAP